MDVEGSALHLYKHQAYKMLAVCLERVRRRRGRGLPHQEGL
jgi:hypothetical protein